MTERALVRRGRIWVFGDHIDTDVIFPTAAFRLPVKEQSALAFSAVRPGWSAEVGEGDLLIAGKGFGTGSARPIGRVLAGCGIAGIVAASANGLCVRNCVNFGMPILQCAEIGSLCREGDTIEVDFDAGVIVNHSRAGTVNRTGGLPSLLSSIVQAGGVIPMLQREGYIERR